MGSVRDKFLASFRRRGALRTLGMILRLLFGYCNPLRFLGGRGNLYLPAIREKYEQYPQTTDVRALLLSEIGYNLEQIKTRLKIICTLAARLILKKSYRSQEKSRIVHESAWENVWDPSYKHFIGNEYSFAYYDKLVRMSAVEFRQRNTIPILAKWIKLLEPHRVLEVGSGAGINLLYLGAMFPNISFEGIEPTDSGVRASQEAIKKTPAIILESELFDPNNPINNVGIRQGNVLDGLPFGEGEFDLVFTTAVIEQLNNFHAEAFHEILRVAKYFLFYEEFLEAQYYVEHYKTLVGNDYFRQSWNIFNRMSVEILCQEIPPYQPSWLKYALVVGRVVPNASL